MTFVQDRVRLGENAVKSGAVGLGDEDTDATAADAIASILHWVENEGGEPSTALSLAGSRYEQETAGPGG